MSGLYNKLSREARNKLVAANPDIKMVKKTIGKDNKVQVRLSRINQFALYVHACSLRPKIPAQGN